MNKKINLACGAGGEETDELIQCVFKKHFYNSLFTSDDAAILEMGTGKLAITTDSFVVTPFEFPGGNIGKLSVCGTVNDLICMGAVPKYIVCSFIIEEGFLVDDLEKIVMSMEEAAKKANIKIVARDTKVVERGQADGVYITTTGVGSCRENVELSGSAASEGDAILVTGDIGRHGCTILLEREKLGLYSNIKSDCASLEEIIAKILDKSKKVHVIRDATRGGLGNVLCEIATQSNKGIEIKENKIPICDEVNGICKMLGLNPLYMANEGTMVIILEPSDAEMIKDLLNKEWSEKAEIIGFVTKNICGKVVLETEIGSKVILPKPSGEMIPRIC